MSPFVSFLLCRLVTGNRKKKPEQALRLLYNDSYSSYNLLLKTERPTMKLSRLRSLAIEVFKTLKSLNPILLLAWIYAEGASAPPHPTRDQSYLSMCPEFLKCASFTRSNPKFNQRAKSQASCLTHLKEDRTLFGFCYFLKNKVNK